MMRKSGVSARVAGFFVLLLALVCAASLPAPAQVSVTTQHNDLNRSGDNLNETILTQSNVNQTTFGLLYKLTLDGQVYAQPLAVAGLSINGGMHNVVYAATANNSIYAFDADTGTQYWHVNLGTPINNSNYGSGCVDINGNAGIIGTPVISTSNNTLYVVNSLNNNGTYSFVLHALNLATGADQAGSPVTITTTGFQPLLQNQRAGLLLANGNLYIPFSSHCDMGAYHGYLFSYNPGTLAQQGLFNTSATGSQNSLWMSGQGPAVDSSGNIYFGTSNGTWDGANNFSESFIKLSPALALEDWFTAANHSTLDSGDLDLDTSGPLLIPSSTSLFMVGKSATGYVINSTNMGHLGDASALQTVTLGGALHGSAIYFNSAVNGPEVYTWAIGDPLKAFKFNGSTLATPNFQAGPETISGEPAAYLSLSANGQSNGIVWANAVLSGDANHGTIPGVLRAYNADNIATELYNNQQNATRDTCDNFAKNGYPTIANGKVYLGGFGTQQAGTGELCIYGLLSDCTLPTAPSGLSASAASAGQVSLTWTAGTSACAPSYTIYRSKTSGFTPSASNQVANGVSGTSYTDNTAAAGTIYYYLVEEVNGGGSSGPSNQASATTPALGSLIIAIDSGSTTAVSPFVADEDASGGSTSGTGNTINTANAAEPAPMAVYQTERFGNFTYTIGGFTAGTNYMVRLHFAEIYWTKAGQRVFNVSINGTQVLSNFDVIAASGAADTAIVEQFVEPANSSGQFVIQYSTIVDNAKSSGIEIDSATGASCSGAPTAPSNLAATAASSSQINLSWTASTAGSGCTISYNVYQSTTSGFTPSSSNEIASGVTGTTYSATGLAASTTYYYLAEAADSAGSSGQSNQASATTSAASCSAAPTAPTGLGATGVSSSQINLSWTASTAGSGCTITYNVYSSTTSGFTPSGSNQIASGVTTASYSNTGLAASTTYYYLVEAVDSSGSSGASNQASATTQASGGGVTQLIAISSGSTTANTPFVADEDFTGGSTTTVTNSINTSEVANPAPTAVYQHNRFGNFTYTIGGFTAASSQTVRLHFAETYWTAKGQRVFNVSINGTQVLTNFDIIGAAGGPNIAVIEQFTEAANSSGQYVIQFTTVTDNAQVNGIEIDSPVSCSTPTAPSGLAATAAGSTQINLSWTAGTSSAYCSVMYNVFRSTTSGFTPSGSNQVASSLFGATYSDTGLTASTTYYYLVESTNSGGTSGASNQATATTSGAATSLSINAGGPAESPFVADEDFSGGATSSVTATINTANVTNPAPMAVYQSNRYGNFTYTIPGFAANSSHTVRLHFAETYWTAAGKREFDVSINGTQVLTDFDIYATAGGEDIANIQQFTESADSTGTFTIKFTSVVDNSLVSGIEID